MIRRLLPLLFLASSVMAQTPALVTSMVSETNGSTSIPVGDTVTLKLANPAQANNLLTTFCTNDTTNSTTTLSETDDKSNTWTLGQRTNNATLTQEVIGLYSPNVAANTFVLSPTVATAATHSMQCAAMEFFDVATTTPLDIHTGSSSSSTSTTITSGATGTLAQTGELLVNCAWMSSDNTGAVTAGSQSNITWKLLDGQPNAGSGVDHFWCQWGVYNSTVSFSPQMTTAVAAKYVSVTLAFKPASAGSDLPAGAGVRFLYHLNLTENIVTSPIKVQIPAPSDVNAVLLMHSGGGSPGGSSITSLNTDSLSNTWHISSTCTQANELVEYAYTQNASVSNTWNVSFNVNLSGGDFSWFIVGMKGMATSAFDKDSGCQTGNQTVAGNLTQGSLTPSTSNGIVFGWQSHVFNTANGVTGANQLFDGLTYTTQSASGPDPMDQNQGPMHYFNPNTSSVSLTWTFGCASGCSGLAASNWAGLMVAFEAPASGTTPVINKRSKLDRLDSGTQ